MEFQENQSVDVPMTDIRMQEMDWFELVPRVQALPSPPITMAISSYAKRVGDGPWWFASHGIVPY